MPDANVCAHGSLARSCEICERDAEIARLTALLVASTTTCQVCGERMPKTSNHKRCAGCAAAHRKTYHRDYYRRVRAKAQP